MSIADLYNIKRAIQRDEEWRPQAEHLTPSGGDDSSPLRSICIFCNKSKAQYACPTCQAPYCSLDCFRSQKHAECAVGFARGAVRDAVREDQEAENGEREREEEGRKVMLGILGRTAALDIGASVEKEAQEEEEEEDGDDEETKDARADELDIFQAEEFLHAWNPLLEKHASTSTSAQDDRSKSDVLLYNIIAVIAAHVFITSDLDIPHFQCFLDDADPGSADVGASTDTTSSTPPTVERPRKLLVPVIQSLFSDLVPFLTTAPPLPTSRKKVASGSKEGGGGVQSGPIKKAGAGQEKMYEVVLQDGEDLVLWLLSRLQPLVEHTGVKPTTLLCQVLSRTADILEDPKVTPTSIPLTTTNVPPSLIPTFQTRSKPLAVLADTYALFPPTSAHIRRKLLYYASVLIRVEGRRLEEVRGLVEGLRREEEIGKEWAGLGDWEGKRTGEGGGGGEGGIETVRGGSAVRIRA
ncbi:hypothetical protein A4X13_0g4564 [Tilletia indica]|uniref:Uncharacterized protein n=1 Tax=Tilletia indica TaxID=43049 RepID=A0A177TTQ9_9BASI|nr:hypothetical protein A4X13_0g4564 [Tilletia indica]